MVRATHTWDHVVVRQTERYVTNAITHDCQICATGQSVCLTHVIVLGWVRGSAALTYVFKQFCLEHSIRILLVSFGYSFKGLRAKVHGQSFLSVVLFGNISGAVHVVLISRAEGPGALMERNLQGA